MRTQTLAQSTALAAVRRREFVRVLTTNPDGGTSDLTALGGQDWVVGVDLDSSIDQPIDSATIRLRRDHGATLSLSPFRTDSTLNRTAALAYAPLLDVARRIAVEVAVLDPAVATTPGAGDWTRVFEGSIDSIDPGGALLVVQARDLGARLADAWLTEKTAVIVTGAAPVAIETVIQTLLNTALGAGVVTLYTPVSPLYLSTRFGYQREPLMDAIQRLVESIGWSCRYQWDAGTSSYRLTLFNPPRAKTTPDVTLGPARYRSLKKFALSRAQVRNSVRVYYSTASGSRQNILVNDAASQARYGTRPLIIEEASDSTISSGAEATTMATALLTDLKDPKADGESDSPLLWSVELNDLVRFSTNGVHFDTDQDLAVGGIRHSLSASAPSSTVLTLRGTPAGAYRSWLRRGGPPIAGGANEAVTNPPSCYFTAVLQSKIDEEVQLTGAPGVNAPASPFQWHTRKSVNGTPGAWTAYATTALPATISVRRDLYYTTQLEAEVLQADGQVATASWSVLGRFDAIDGTTGKINHGTPFSEGGYAGKATDVNGFILDPNVQDNRASLLNTHFRYATDSAAGIVETAGQKFVHGSYIDGSRRPVTVYDPIAATDVSGNDLNVGQFRARTGLDTSGYLQTGVNPLATVSGIPAVRAVASGSRFFSEAFDVLPATWFVVVAGTLSLNTVSAYATVGRATLEIIGNDYRCLPYVAALPYNPTKLYRLRARVAQSINPTAGGALCYIGVRCLNSAGVSQGDIWVAMNGVTLTVAGGFQEVTGWFSGTSGTNTVPGTDPRTATTLPVGTTQVCPGYAVNHSGGNGTVQFDYLEIEVFDEDAADRIYGGMDTGSNLYQTVQQYDTPGSTLNKRPLKGYQTGTCNDGQVVTFGQAFHAQPMVVFSRGNGTVTYQPDTLKWTVGTFDATKAQIEDIYAQGLTAAGFTCHAKLRQMGGTTHATAQFPTSNSLTAVSTATQLAVGAFAPSSSGHYTVRYKASVTTQSNRSGIAHTTTIVVVINKRAGGSTGAITELRRDTYSVTDPDGTGPYTNATGILAFDIPATLGTTDYLEVALVSLTNYGTALGPFSCAVHGCNSNTTDDGAGNDGLSFTFGTADAFAKMTPNTGDTVRWEAYSVQ